ncbi:MAG: hypothetical protein Q4C77_07625 [Eubacteriales bacterium]|nr:hypothetical protein [Eubacteriales bacterium]
MVQTNNIKEKRLLVIRQLIIKKIDSTDENIISVWCDLFPNDKLELNETELLEWIKKYVNKTDIKSCEKRLAKVRQKRERSLRAKGTYVGYGAKLLRQPKDALATYIIFTKGRKYSGDYNSLCRRISRLSKE